MKSWSVSRAVIEKKILLIRGRRVMLDKELACLYGVKPIALRQQVRRNKKRFPVDFMFKLTRREARFLVSQNVIPSFKNLGGYLPYAFTEQGVAMLSSVLRSRRAIQVNVTIMRTFARLREILSTHKELEGKLKILEQMIGKHDAEIQAIFKVIKQLMAKPEGPKRRIGFHSD